jgi:hypothetical protein
VESRVKTIKKGKLTGILTDTATVTFTDKFLNEQTVEWIASTLVHEARHQQQYIDGYKYGFTRSDQGRELDAMKLQAQALYFFGGRKSAVDDLLTQDGLHFDSNGNGILDDEDDWGY